MKDLRRWLRAPTIVQVRLLLRLIIGMLLTALALAQLGGPASARPGQVSPPYAIASSPHSITLKWPAKGGAARYEVLYATSYNGVKKSSAQSRRTSGKRTTLKVTGLRPDQMYCFMVRGLGKGVGNRSERHCKSTMRSTNKTSRKKVSVATFNVCGAACSGWSRRQSSVVQRIRETNAQVVAIQEGSGRIAEIASRLSKEGYALASASTTEAVFYRTSALSPVTKTAPDPGCSGDEQPACEAVETPVAGDIYLGNRATAAWAQLRLKSNRTRYVFVSAHLSNGKSSAKSKDRDRETASLITQARKAAGGVPIVFAGDFNSTRNRPTDSPRLRMAKNGWYDAYDRSSTYTNPHFDSYNDFKRKVKRSIRYGDHVDRVFIRSSMGSAGWKVVVRAKGGRYVGTMASDHNPVRTTLYLP